MPLPSRHLVTAIGGVVVAAVLAACGNAPGAGTGGTTLQTVGPIRSVTAQPVAADGALECPATITDQQGMTVPEKPQGVDGNARLLPDREPESLVVCSYPVLDMMTGSLTAPFRLEARTVLSASERSRMVDGSIVASYVTRSIITLPTMARIPCASAARNVASRLAS